MKNPLEHYPGYALRRAASAMMAELASLLEQVDLRVVDVSILIISGANAGIRSSTVGNMLDIQRPNMVPRIANLEGKGLIKREPIDGKSQGLSLTRKGEEKYKEALSIIENFENRMMMRIPEKDRVHFIPALNALRSKG